jgi:hypothetical protein
VIQVVKRLIAGCVLLLASMSSCSSGPQKPKAKAEPDEPLASSSSSSSSSSAIAPASPSTTVSSPPPSRRECILVQDENPVPVRVVGVLKKASSPNGTDAPFVLHLKEARCVIGLPRASFVREVYVATTGPDLRPLVDRPISITGNAIGGLSDMGGPAVIVLARDIENAVGANGTTPAP